MRDYFIKYLYNHDIEINRYFKINFNLILILEYLYMHFYKFKNAYIIIY